jgi:hypothetical protein
MVVSIHVDLDWIIKRQPKSSKLKILPITLNKKERV